MSEAAIERHQGDALSQIVGTGDTRAALATLEQNVKDIIDVARARGFVRSYGGGHEFFGFPAWSLLAMTYGLVPFVEWTRPVDNGWEARAVVKTRDGAEVGAAEAMCTRQEGNRRNADPHTLRAMAQTRAMRNALRGCLGAALVLSGFDFADPDAPLDDGQLAALHISERALGMTHDQGHADAGIDSYKNLTREQAGEIIDRRQRELEASESRKELDEGAPGKPAPAEEGFGEGPEPATVRPGAPTIADPDEPATAEQWKIAERHGLTGRKALAIAKGLRFGVTSYTQLTGAQLSRVLSTFLDGKRG